MTRETPLEWYVYYESVNSKEITELNVFQHDGFMDGCRTAARKCNGDKEVFAEKVRRELMYYFWCKCEYEIVLTGWPPSKDHEEDRKVDVFSQVMMNFDRFIDYLWDNLALLKRRAK